MKVVVQTEYPFATKRLKMMPLLLSSGYNTVLVIYIVLLLLGKDAENPVRELSSENFQFPGFLYITSFGVPFCKSV